MAYGSESVLREAEARDQPYLTKLRLTKNVKHLIKSCSAPTSGKKQDKAGTGSTTR